MRAGARNERCDCQRHLAALTVAAHRPGQLQRAMLPDVGGTVRRTLKYRYGAAILSLRRI
jgi:hypothetical protein